MDEKQYLHELSLKIRKTLGGQLIGLYQIGSACLGEYQKGKSDLDVVGVISNLLTDGDRNRLSRQLEHKSFACPAEGLDLYLFTKDQVAKVASEPHYEFGFTTGHNQTNGVWEKGQDAEMLIFFELCRKHGVVLFGVKPEALFAPVEKHKIVEAFLKIIRWHQTKILDPYHDPKGQNSVLNACRMLAFVKEDKWFSKSDGGKWFLSQEPNNELVKKALRIRQRDEDVEMNEDKICSFLSMVLEII